LYAWYKVILWRPEAPSNNIRVWGARFVIVDMKKPKLTSKQKRQEAEILERTAIKLIEKSVELKGGNRPRKPKKKGA
jgi:hypothetical protein